MHILSHQNSHIHNVFYTLYLYNMIYMNNFYIYYVFYFLNTMHIMDLISTFLYYLILNEYNFHLYNIMHNIYVYILLIYCYFCNNDITKVLSFFSFLLFSSRRCSDRLARAAAPSWRRRHPPRSGHCANKRGGERAGERERARVELAQTFCWGSPCARENYICFLPSPSL